MFGMWLTTMNCPVRNLWADHWEVNFHVMSFSVQISFTKCTIFGIWYSIWAIFHFHSFWPWDNTYLFSKLSENYFDKWVRHYLNMAYLPFAFYFSPSILSFYLSIIITHLAKQINSCLSPSSKISDLLSICKQISYHITTLWVFLA